ncbi:uncharacterized protein LOC142564576 [Dermacentor variabilis]|uniref:uncharacterized protein LOC142564576 n=1 Tax=Dermacentor variabilis TaxID=34621 RepID=UPI003F5C95D4
MAPSSRCAVVCCRWCCFPVLLLAMFLLSAVNADRPTKSAVYYMDDLCGSSHTAAITVGVAGLESAVVLRATKHHIDHDFNCTVNVTTRVDRSLLYSISFLDLPMTCLSYLELWADRRDAQRFCRNVDDPRGKEAHWVTAPQLLVQLVTSRHDWNYERKAFEIVLTSYRQSLHFDGCYKGEYQCGNKFCIWRELTCNNENNCGDLSDENCMSKTLAVAVTVAAGITVVVLIFALVAYIRKRAQVGPHDLSRTTSSQSVHSAGSGISGAYDTTYRPLVGRHLLMEPLLEVPSVQASGLPSRTSSEDNVPKETQGSEKRLRPCIRYDRSVSDPM